MADIHMDYMWGIFPPTYMVIVDGKIRDYITCRDGKRITWAQEKDIISGYQEWYDSEPSA